MEVAAYSNREETEAKVAKFQEENDVSADLKKLKQQIEDLVIITVDPIPLDYFWEKFRRVYKSLPTPKAFGLKKRHEFLSLVKKCRVVTVGGRNYVTQTQLVSQESPETTTSATNKGEMQKSNQKQRTKNPAESSATASTSRGQKDSAIRKKVRTHSRSESETRTDTSRMAYQNPYHQTPQSRDHHGRSDTQIQNLMHVQPMYQGPHFNQQHGHQPWQNTYGLNNYGRSNQRERQSIREPQNLEIKHVPKDEVNAIAEDCIDRLVEAKELVSPERVEKLVLDHYKVGSLHQIGIRYLEHLKCVNNLIRAQARVNAYIQGFIRIRAIATLFELRECLKEYTENKQDFQSLRLGPLTKQPLVYDYFKFPGDDEIPQIDTAAVLDQLRNYMTENNLWSARLEMEGFMSYLVTQFQVESPFCLGIRIKSLPLAAGVLKKSQRDLSQANQAHIRMFTSSAEETMAAAFRNFSSSVLVEEAGLCNMRKELMKMPASKVVEQVFTKLHVLQSSLVFTPGPFLDFKQSKSLQRAMELTKQFSNLLKNDDFYGSLFKLAVCSSWEELHKSLQFIIGYEDKEESRGANQAGPSSTQEKKAPRPRIGDIVSKVLSYLERCFVHGSLSLSHLSRIENKLLEEYDDFPSFYDLTNKTFLEVLNTDDDVKRYLEENGGATLGSAGEAGSGTGYQAALVDLHDFIMQAELQDSSQVSDLERALCWHYHVAEVKLLGHGSAASLQAGAVRNVRYNKQQHVKFEVALCAKESQSALGTNTSRVGLLGHQVRESAAICLHNCPLLTNMAEWSHWDLIFKPELGELKDFIRKNGGIHSITVPGTNRAVITQIVAMESQPGTLLKLTADASNDLFANAAIAGDVLGTCGHLASLVAINKGIQNTPLALLGNHLKTGLLKIQSSTAHDEDAMTGNDAGSIAVGSFVVECLTMLPFVTCQAVASQVFIEPLSDVVGQTKSRELLLSCAKTDMQRSRLQVLGLLLGIDHWSATFQQRLEPPAVTLASKVALITASAKDPDLVELSSDDEASDDEESDFLNTSDESDDEEKITKNEPESIVVSADEETMVIDSDSEDPSIVEVPSSSDSNSKTDLITEIKPESEVDAGDETSGNTAIAPLGMDEATKAYWDVIEDIRRTEFGINVTLSLEGEKLMKKQQDRLGRSLDRLSNDLYSKDTHFVLELIQNADDNQYPAEGGTVPSIKFIVEPESITVLNNECGFEERNIRAICDVGKSTKGKHKAGYIGQKGIGFKSVFRVTDCPQIHSNGYHFRFDLSTGPQGYILPHWVDKVPDHSERWMTRITLPLKEDVVNSSKLRQLAARFQDVHPSLLLFLHRLRSITVINKIGEYKAKMERRDIGNGILEIRHMMGSDRQTTKTDRWLVAKKVLDASHISSQAKSGVEVESTEIALAFPLHEVNDSQALPPKQPVFAFLPLRSYGFRFVIQGDFDVPSSREDVDRDSMWNQWLQSEIHSLFVDALQLFKEQRNLSAVEAVCLFVKFIPLEDEILDFFRPVATQIVQRLRSEPCLPADSSPGQVPMWHLPSQLILSTDNLLRDIATPELLQNKLGLSYLHQDVAARINPSLLSGLGVQVLNTAHLVEIGRALTQTISQATESDKPQWIKRLAKWFAAVFRSLDEFNVDKKILSQIEALPIIPLSNGEITCLKDNAIFFPLGAEETDEEDTSQDLVVYLEKDLNTVDSSLLAPLDEVSRPQAWRLLEMLGVRRLKPGDIIHHHIIPALRASNVMTKPPGLLTAYIVYIKEELDRQPNLVPLEELKDLAVILTNRGLKRPAKVDVHFSPAFGNKLDLEKELPGFDWVLVDPVYLVRSTTSLDIQTWHHFLAALGVHDLIAVSPGKVTVSREDIAQSAWSEHAKVLPATEHEFVLQDYDCEQFMALVTENTHTQTYHRQMQVLFDIIDSYWEPHFAKFTMTQLCAGSGCVLREVESTFGMMLKRLKWVPAVEVLSTSDPEGRSVSQTQQLEHLGQNLYVQSGAMERLLAHHVPYLHSFKTQQSKLCEFLGMRTSLTCELLQELLVRWSTRTAIDTPRVLLTSMAHIRAVYTFLLERLPPKDLQDLFHNHPVLFEPKADMSLINDPQTVIEGHMMARSEVRWNDPTGLFGKYKSVLMDQNKNHMVKAAMSRHYHDMEDLMLRSARLATRPTLLEYAELVIVLSNSFPVQQVIIDLLQLFSLIGAELEPHTQTSAPPSDQSLPFEVQQAINKLKPHAVFPTKKSKWTRLSEHPLIADDKQTERMFSSKEGVLFLVTDDKLIFARTRRKDRRGAGPVYNSDHVISLYRACGVACVSDVLTAKYVTESFQVCPAVHRYVAAVLPYIQSLLCGEHPDVYDAHQERKIGEHLSTMKFVQVARLEVVYHLKPLPDVVVVLSEVCKWKDDEDEFAFYVHKDSTSATHEINKELACYFSRGDDACMKEIKLLLIELMPLVRDESPAMQEFLHQRDIKGLPADEKPWKLPPPPEVKPPPPPPPPPRPVRPQTPDVPATSTEQRSDGLKSWPPRSNPAASGDRVPSGPLSAPRSTMWPPPAPPSRPDHTNVPQGLRPMRSPHPESDQVSTASSVVKDSDQGSELSDTAQSHHKDISRGSSVGSSASSGYQHTYASGQGGVSQGHSAQSTMPGGQSSMSHEQSRGLSQQELHGAGHHKEGYNAGSQPGRTEEDHLRDRTFGSHTTHNRHAMQTVNEQEPPPPGVDMDIEMTDLTSTPISKSSLSDSAAESPFKTPTTPGLVRSGQKRVRLESGASTGSTGDQNQTFWFDVPTWGDQSVEETLEEIPCTTKLPEDMPLSDGDEEGLTGRWGENLVYNYLLSQKDDPNSQVFYVKWLNEERETELPFDCEVHHYDPETETTRRIYIEVKATRSDKKAFFPISGSELKCAFAQGEDYHLYRVFNAGNQQTVRLTKLENLAAKVESKHVRLCLVI